MALNMVNLDRALLFILSVSSLVGCAQGTKTVPVSGVVTLDGKPLPEAHVTFQLATEDKVANAGSFAFTDANGAYSLRTFEGEQPGAVVGKYRVSINLVTPSFDGDPAKRPPAKTLPAKYNRQTELQFDVAAGGTDKANFDLKSK